MTRAVTFDYIYTDAEGKEHTYTIKAKVSAGYRGSPQTLHDPGDPPEPPEVEIDSITNEAGDFVFLGTFEQLVGQKGLDEIYTQGLETASEDAEDKYQYDRYEDD